MITETIELVRNYLDVVRKTTETLEIRPRLNIYGDRVLLALFSKIFRVSEAVCVLASPGLYSEAFGISRTGVEAFLNIRHIVNQDTEQRSKRFVEYFGKERENLVKVFSKYGTLPNDAKYSEDHAQLLAIAKQFNSPHNWRVRGMTVKDIAYEPSSWAKDGNGDPEVWEYAYDAIYRLTSHEAHATCVAVGGDFERFSKSYRFPPAFDFNFKGTLSDGMSSLFNASLFMHASILHVFYRLDLAIPDEIPNEYEVVRKHFAV
jgi:hypothetical protein